MSSLQTPPNYRSITIAGGPELYEALLPWVAEKSAFLEEIRYHTSLLTRLAKAWVLNSSAEKKDRLLDAWLDFYAHMQFGMTPPASALSEPRRLTDTVEISVETFEEDFQLHILRREELVGHRLAIYDELIFQWMSDCEKRYCILEAECDRMSQVYAEYLEAKRAGFEFHLGYAWLVFLGRITKSPYWQSTISPLDLPRVNAAFAFVVRLFDGIKFYYV